MRPSERGQLTGGKRLAELSPHVVVFCLLAGILSSVPATATGDDAVFDELQQTYTANVFPLLSEFCLECHSTELQEGELDLERFSSFDDVRRDPATWIKVEEFLGNGEMPPEDNAQLSDVQHHQLRGWIDRYLDAEARANAGDPGPVVLRRLNNAEYTWTVRELTGIDLNPAVNFPSDGAAGEGFTNIGTALVMSPALVEKYLDAAREIAAHAVLLPDGIEFSPDTTRQDWSNERVEEIRAIYRHHTSGNQDVSALDRWSVADYLSATNADGRLDLAPYLLALVGHPELWTAESNSLRAIAEQEGLNQKYLQLLVSGLSDGDSLLNAELRRRLQNATPVDVPDIVAEISRWQEQLWRFDAVGHMGIIRPWQATVSPITASREFRVPIERAPDGGDPTLHLVASTPFPEEGQHIEWRNARIERPGAPTILLREVRGATAVLERIRAEALVRTPDYLDAVFDVRSGTGGVDSAALAEKHGVDPRILRAWLSYLGLSSEGEAALGELLHHRLEAIGAYDFVKGWGLPGVNDLSLVANSSDQKVNIPGDMSPHRVAVHPRPEKFVAVGWRSPLEGEVRVAATVQDAHSTCGNSVTWSIDHRHGAQRRVLRSGVVELGGAASIQPVESLHVRSGEVVSLVIGPRDANHACDLTEIDLLIRETGGEERSWSLAGDCADSIDAGNPHPDSYGHHAVWNFFTEMIDGEESQLVVPEDSVLAAWLESTDEAEAKVLAEQIGDLLCAELTDETPAADAVLREQLVSLGGPLFGQLEFAALAATVHGEDLASATFGIDPAQFDSDSTTLVTHPPSAISFQLPADLFDGTDFVVTAGLSASTNPEAIVQFDVSATAPDDVSLLQPGVPFVVAPDNEAEERLHEWFDEFRSLFPAAMCYARIVPVDEVVTLVLYHREDDHIARLMLSDAEQARLDVLWDELHYVSRDALRIEVALEQLLEFATQDADPARFDPVREPIAEAAALFHRRLLETRPSHIEAVLEFAPRAWRRPLTTEESNRLRALYSELTANSISHEDAIRLMLARVLTAPAFLYRLEQPGSGSEPTPVSDWELATRLSYFLWASPPDEGLRSAAATGELSTPESLQAQTRRMLKDDRVRRLAIEFGCQWLHIRNFDQHAEKNERLYPEFPELRDDMYEESVRFFTDFFQGDRSVLSILDADHTFLNESLAAHYGVPGVDGDDWRRVDGVGEFGRGGILTQATLLASQSGASRTSPILRGNWVSETLLGERLPRPPKDVPVLPETVPDGLTERELIEQHSSVEECAKCHARIDPYGFALENFDAIGRLRMETSAGDPIDVQTTLIDGTELTGAEGLRDYLLTTRRHEFLRQFCRKLLGYALGRSVQLSDQPLLDEIIRQLAENDYRVSVAVEAIVRSPQFRMIRGAEQHQDHSSGSN